jgi:parvulin-like peptidyl-prolyl isomerase
MRQMTKAPLAHTALAGIAAISLAFGCTEELKPIEGKKTPAVKTKTSHTTPPRTKTVKPRKMPPRKPMKRPPTPKLTKRPAQPPEYSGAHILVAYKGARRANPKITRSKDEAKKLAEKLVKQAKAAPKKFAELAKKHSDGPSAKKGGSLGTWRKGRMVPAFDKAVAGLKIGQIADKPVETPFGFHVIIRNKLGDKVSGAMIVISHDKVRRSRPRPGQKPRSKEDAQKLANKLVAELKKNPKKFAELCKKHSDGPAKDRGGYLGVWRAGAGHPMFDKHISALKVGQVSKVVDSPFGLGIFQRMKVPSMHAGSHILLAYKGGRRSRPWIKRTKDEAKALAAKLIKEIKADPKKFETLANKHSDGPTARYGGDLGQWHKGQMVKAFDETIAKLKDGQVHPEPVESPFGFHVIRRNKLAKAE